MAHEYSGTRKKNISLYKTIGTIFIIWGVFILSFALLFLKFL
jgi:hypothetical protein